MGLSTKTIELGLPERWILSKLNQTIEQVTKAINTYRFDLAAQAIHEFTWDEYCDWYLELSKPILMDNAASESLKIGTRQTLVKVLELLVRLCHPFMPFITEEIWQRLAPLLDKHGDTIMLQPFPDIKEAKFDIEAVREIEWVKAFIMGIRRIRAERDIAPGKKLPVQIKGGTKEEKNYLKNNIRSLQTLGRIESITETEIEPGDAVVTLAGDMALFVPLADLIDLDAELIRQKTELGKRKNEQAILEKKLSNEKFVNRAPKEVVDKERKRMEIIATAIETLEKQVIRVQQIISTQENK